MLETRDLTVRFGGHVAVDAVSCTFLPGTLTAIVGPNGAGKTTYFNALSGQVRASAGSIHWRGRDLTAQPVARRAQGGLGRAFQLTQLFPNLSVVENVRLAVQARRREGFRFWSVWSDHRNTLERAHALLERVRLGDRAHDRAASLPHGDQRKLEVAMLMAQEPGAYLFDEPTAGMGVDEVPVILDLIAALKQQRDKVILLVEHKLDVVRRLADRIVVLHNGRLVADGPPEQVMASPIVQKAYLGLVPPGEA